MRRLAGAGPAPAASGGNGTGGRAGALARSILWLSTGEPDAGCESRQSSESLQPAPCAPPAPGRSRPAARPAALARAVASARHAAAAVLVVAAALFALAAPAQAQDTTPVWSTTMTVGESTRGGNRGFYAWVVWLGGSLDSGFLLIGIGTTSDTLWSKPCTWVDNADSGQLTTEIHSGWIAVPRSPTTPTYTLVFAGETLPLADATSVAGTGLTDSLTFRFSTKRGWPPTRPR